MGHSDFTSKELLWLQLCFKLPKSCGLSQTIFAREIETPGLLNDYATDSVWIIYFSTVDPVQQHLNTKLWDSLKSAQLQNMLDVSGWLFKENFILKLIIRKNAFFSEAHLQMLYLNI